MLRRDMDVADFATVGLVGLDVDPAVRVPQADRTVLAAAQAVVAVAVEPRRQYGAFVAFKDVCFCPRKLRRAHLSLSARLRFWGIFGCRFFFRGGNRKRTPWVQELEVFPSLLFGYGPNRALVMDELAPN